MRIEAVTAHAFGPLTDTTLDLAPGMTVVSGANESAKSSWHAALYSAVCGRRRGRGAQTKEERRYAELHRPWEGIEWRVSATVLLDDGRRVELTHDLEGKVDCRATDIALARDISNEIMYDGSPDGSRFLGLDRKSFAATACVNQAELLSVLAAADSLQEQLQRAAATAGADATAAAALECLAGFQRERVGVDRTNSKKPLRAAKTQLAGAEDALADARAQHDKYLQLVQDAESSRDEADKARSRVLEGEQSVHLLQGVLEASRTAAADQVAAERAAEEDEQAAEDLDIRRRRLQRATVIHDHFGGVAPVGLSEQDHISQTVSAAIASWKAAPSPRALTGPTAAALQAQRDELPQLPDGDTVVNSGVRELATEYQRAAAIVAKHATSRPADEPEPDPQVAAAAAAGPARVRELAWSLAALDPSAPFGNSDANTANSEHDAVPDELDTAARELEAARGRQRETATAANAAQRAADDADIAHRAAQAAATTSAAGKPSTLPMVLFATAAVAAIAGLVLLATGQPFPGTVALAAAAAALAGAVANKSRTQASVTSAATRATGDQERQAAVVAERARRVALDAERQLAAAEGAHNTALAAARRTANMRSDIFAECAAYELPADAAALRTLAARAEHLHQRLDAARRWVSEDEQNQTEAARIEKRLREALVAHDVPTAADVTVPVLDAVDAYERACAARADQAAQAQRASTLEQALADRISAETAAGEVNEARSRAHRLLADAAALAQVDVDAEDVDSAALVTLLELWQRDHAAKMGQAEHESRQWAEFNTLLDGAALDEVAATVDNLRAQHRSLTAVTAEAASRARDAAANRDRLAAAAGLDTDQADDPEFVSKHLTAAQDDLAAFRASAATLAAAADNSAGAMTERARNLPSVPEAEERLAAAQLELNRVTSLDDTLQRTIGYLEAAQQRVHRDVAPVLARTLSAWLPSITGGRYTDARVDPETLRVQVRGASGHWRLADRLSIGTMEQVYLLLRVALAQHLATSDESCPLLLDDVTVQADGVRTLEILDLLLRLSQERQVIVFAQEPAVADWAREHLGGTEQHAVRELTLIPST